MTKMTGKAMLVVALSMAFALAIACKTAPSSPPAPAGLEPTTPEEAALKTIYERYYTDLILDGAGTYTVRSGDTLAHIARSSEYHSGYYYPIIMLASKDIILDPDKIQPGMVLTVPDLQKNLDNTRARAGIKNFLGEVAKIEDDRNRHETANGLRELADSL